MGRVLVDQLLHLLDDGFEGGEWHSLLGNLRHVTAEDWLWLPPGGRRTIQEIVRHVGACKWMYENHAFGDGALTWDDPLVDGADQLGEPEAAQAWLRRSQARLRTSLAALDDAELERPRRTNWGTLESTRWIAVAMIQHDLYHAGEINHLRSLRLDDRWAHERSG
jgi:hypothetical protein